VEVRGHGPQRLALVDDDLLGVEPDGLRLGFGDSGGRERRNDQQERSADDDAGNEQGSEKAHRPASTGGQAQPGVLGRHRISSFIRTIPPAIGRTYVLFNMPIEQMSSPTRTSMRQ